MNYSFDTNPFVLEPKAVPPSRGLSEAARLSRPAGLCGCETHVFEKLFMIENFEICSIRVKS